MPEDKKELQVYIPEHLRAGTFSNVASINITSDKKIVILDFIFRAPDNQNTLVSRIILSNEHAQSVVKVLSDLLKQ